MPTFADCARRAAFRQFAPIIAEVSTKFGDPIGPPKRTFSRAARLGHAVHKRLELMYAGKADPDFADEGLLDLATRQVLVAGPDKRNELEEDEPAWDDLPENEEIDSLETAEKMIDNMVPAMQELVSKKTPLVMEKSISTQMYGLLVTGHPDQINDDGSIGDSKSHGTTLTKNYIAQLGTYGAIVEDLGEKVTGLEQYNFQRLKTKPSPLRIERYLVTPAIEYAQTIIQRTANNLENYIDTGDPNSFNANPQSPMCSAKWCDAWGTNWCKLHKGAK